MYDTMPRSALVPNWMRCPAMPPIVAGAGRWRTAAAKKRRYDRGIAFLARHAVKHLVAIHATTPPTRPKPAIKRSPPTKSESFNGP
jgi:hypothetical protein